MNSKPPVELRPRIGGGCKTITRASRTFPASSAWSFAASPFARSSGVVRFDHSSSVTKTTPLLLWLVEVIRFRPSSVTTCSTPSSSRRSSSTRLTTFDGRLAGWCRRGSGSRRSGSPGPRSG